MAGTVDLGACVSYGFESVKKNIGFHVVAVVILMIINSFTAGILGGPFLLGYFKALEKADKGESPEIGDLFGCLDRFLPAFLVTLICGALIAVGYLVFVLPGILIAPLLTVSLMAVFQGETDAVAAIKKGWAAFQPNFIMAALTLFILGIIMSVGVLACGIGVLFTAPVGIAGMYKLGQQMLPPQV